MAENDPPRALSTPPTPAEDLRAVSASLWRWLRRPIQVAAAVGLVWLAFGAAQVWYHRNFGPLGGYHLFGLNYLDRPISDYWVNDSWGANMFAGRAGGGGGSTCCILIDRTATTVKVRWTLSYTLKQEQSGYKAETREAIVELPKITDPDKGYIGVHFLPGNKVVLTYSDWIPSPIQPIPEIEYALDEPKADAHE